VIRRANGGGFASWRDFLLAVDQDPVDSRVLGWKDQLALSHEASKAFARGYARLQTIIINDVPRSLVHGDLLNRNVHVVGTRISGVFDWGNSLLGDHLYDLGLLCFWEPWKRAALAAWQRSLQLRQRISICLCSHRTITNVATPPTIMPTLASLIS